MSRTKIHEIISQIEQSFRNGKTECKVKHLTHDEIRQLWKYFNNNQYIIEASSETILVSKIITPTYSLTIKKKTQPLELNTLTSSDGLYRVTFDKNRFQKSSSMIEVKTTKGNNVVSLIQKRLLENTLHVYFDNGLELTELKRVVEFIDKQVKNAL